MHYISTKFDVGSIVYAYSQATDSVHRLKVVSIRATCKNNIGDFDLSYAVQHHDGRGEQLELSEDDLHRSPRDAFPELPLPAAEPDHQPV